MRNRARSRTSSDTVNSEASPTLYENSLNKLSEYLFRHHGEKAVILMDEYDAPIHTGFYHGYYDEIITLMKSLMGNAFKDNKFLHKGVITGDSAGIQGKHILRFEQPGGLFAAQPRLFRQSR